MLKQIKAWFAPPNLGGNEEQIMLVNLLNANMISINIYLFLVVVSYFLGAKMALGVIIFDTVLFFCNTIFRNWLYQGRVKMAGVGLLVASYISITLVVISMGTVTSPGTNTYVLLVILSGVIFRRRGVIISAFFTSIAVLALILAENAGILPAKMDFDPIPQWLTYSLVFLVAGTLINYAMQTLLKALDSLKRENAERQQAATLQETIYQIAEAAQSAQSLQALYPLIQTHISRVMDANNFYIALYDESTELLGFAYSVDEKDNSYISPYPPTRGLTAYVLQSGKSLFYKAGVPNQLSQEFQPFGMECVLWLGVPLILRGRTIGVMAVQHYSDPAAYSEREQRMLEFVSSQVATVIDRKQTEDQLRESHERFRQIAENIQETFWIIDAQESKFIYVSPAYRRLWGNIIEEKNFSAAMYMEAILHDDRSIMEAALREQAAGENTSIRYRIRRPDGIVCWVWDRCFPIFDETGKLVRKVGVTTDITDVKNAEAQLETLNRELEMRVAVRTAELKQSEATYRALFENSNDGIFLLSPAGDEIKANQRALEMLGISFDEYQKNDFAGNHKMIAPEQQELITNQITAVARGESVPIFESVFLTQDGHRLDVEINLSGIRDSFGNLVMIQSVVRDITTRKKAELALRTSRDELHVANLALEKASRLKDEFLASMSHELRTPLTGILGLSEILQMQLHGSLNEKQLKAVKNIEDSGKHLLDLINDILDLSKIEANKLDLQYEYCVIDDICHSSLQLTRGMAHQKRQHVQFSSNAHGIGLRADPRRLKQMLVNLLSNAIKFTPDGGLLGLDVVFVQEEHVISFTVWDNGIGIKAEDIERLFQPFVQLDASLSRQYTGTGLGLSLVHRLAQLHAGNVRVESKPGEGSRFTITLPWNKDFISARVETKPETPENEMIADVNISSVQPGQPQIIFVDDDEIIVSTFADLLLANNYKVITARSAEELLRILPLCKPDLIMTDVQMPGMDGLQAIRSIRMMDLPRMKAIPIIAVTALAAPNDEQKCVEAGATSYLSKPINIGTLLELLRTLLYRTKQ